MSTSQHSPLSIDLPGVGSADGCLLTADEVAAILRVPRSWIYSHLSELPVIRLGRYVRFQALRSGTISRKSRTLPMIFVGATPRSRSKHHGKEIVMRERHQRPRVQDCGVKWRISIGITVPRSVAVVPKAGRRAWFPPEPKHSVWPTASWKR
jgi:hypothetical protein